MKNLSRYCIVALASLGLAHAALAAPSYQYRAYVPGLVSPVCSTPWGSSLRQGESVLAYQSATAPYGSSCTSETRTCSQGVLTGSYANAGCIETVAANCTLPWGGTLAHGATYSGGPVYSKGTVSDPATCASVTETLSCNNGVLSDPTATNACAVADPNFASVVLLMHFDGSTEAQMLTEVTGKSLSVVGGGSAVPTTSSKFGGGAVSFIGNGYIQLPSSADLTFAGDFTIEFWAYWINNSVALGSDYSAGINHQIQFTQGIYAGSGWMGGSFGVGNSWHHYAITRKANTVYIGVDGTITRTAAWNGGSGFNLSHGAIGALRNGGGNMVGYMDELRISKVARYPTNYTVPTGPFPDR